MNLKAKWELKFFSEKMDFPCFLELKTGNLSNFTLDKFFVPLVSAHFHYIFMKLQVLRAY
jgi:hypothetical protein